MSVKKILLLGNPKLYEVSENVKKEELNKIQNIVQDLHDTMMDFRQKYGVGRAIAAPQIGEMKRLIYMNIDNPIVFINPRLTFKDDEMIELWDDCMSFPDLLVKVKRYKNCVIDYLDMNWEKQSMKLEGDLSELLQHEYDHLDGILAVMRVVDNKSLAFKGAITEDNKIKVSFYNKDANKDKLKFSVIMADYNNKWIIVRHKTRDTWEIPGGHIEKGEDAGEAASRELHEETGAKEFHLEPVCVYSVRKNKGTESFGKLFYAKINELGEFPDSEIEEIKFVDKISGSLTYPDIQPILADRVQEYLLQKNK